MFMPVEDSPPKSQVTSITVIRLQVRFGSVLYTLFAYEIKVKKISLSKEVAVCKCECLLTGPRS